jgi:hypothetical protein
LGRPNFPAGAPQKSKWIAILWGIGQNSFDHEDRRDGIRLIRAINARSNDMAMKNAGEPTSWRMHQR